MENCWKTCTSDFFKKMKSGPVRRMREKSKNRKVAPRAKSRKTRKTRKVEKSKRIAFLLFYFLYFLHFSCFSTFLFFYFSHFSYFSIFLAKNEGKKCEDCKNHCFSTFWLFSFFSFFFFSYFSQPKTCTDKKIPNVTSNWLSLFAGFWSINLEIWQSNLHMYSQEDECVWIVSIPERTSCYIVIAMRPSGMDFSTSQIMAEVTQVRLTMAEHEPRNKPPAIWMLENWMILEAIYPGKQKTGMSRLNVASLGLREDSPPQGFPSDHRTWRRQ